LAGECQNAWFVSRDETARADDDDDDMSTHNRKRARINNKSSNNSFATLASNSSEKETVTPPTTTQDQPTTIDELLTQTREHIIQVHYFLACPTFKELLNGPNENTIVRYISQLAKSLGIAIQNCPELNNHEDFTNLPIF
ncbi:hypothetical protein FRC11_009957, partial [Ceratobasidium sp. 423]